MPPVEPLISLLGRSEFSNASLAVLSALGEIGDPRAIEPLIERCDTCAHSERYIVAFNLGKIGDLRAVEPLKSVLARWESQSPADDDAKRKQLVDCRAIERAIKEIARANDIPDYLV